MSYSSNIRGILSSLIPCLTPMTNDSSYSWANLPAESLHLILDHLPFAECVRFGAVCKLWRSAIANAPRLKALRFPWLANLHNFTLFSPIEDQIYHLKLPVICNSDSRVVSSSRGWLIFSNKLEGIHLFNPFTNQPIKLHFSPTTLEWDRFKKVVLSSSFHVENCIMAAIHHDRTLAFYCTRNQIWSIKYYDSRTSPLEDIIFFKGIIYCVTSQHGLISFEFSPGPPMIRKECCIVKDYVRPYNGSNGKFMYLVEFEEQLMLVIRYWVFTEEHDSDAPRTIHFAVYRLNFRMGSWEVVESLNNKMLLLDDVCLLCLDATNFSAAGFKSNCIYFMNDMIDEYTWRVFNFADKKIGPFSLVNSRSISSPTIWIEARS